MRRFLWLALLPAMCGALSSCSRLPGFDEARAENYSAKERGSGTYVPVRSAFNHEAKTVTQIAEKPAIEQVKKDTKTILGKSANNPALSVPHLQPAAVDKSVPVTVKVIEVEAVKTDSQILEELVEAEKTKKIHQSLAREVNKVAQRLAMQGDYRGAERLLGRLIHLCRDPQVADQRNLGLALNNLGMLFCKRHKYGKAEPLLQGSLLIQQQALGPESPAFAEGINNLATLYYEQLRYKDAEPLFTRAADILRKAPDEYKPQLAKTMNNLAGCYSHQNRLRDAEHMLDEVMDLDNKLLGAEHPDVAATMNNLGYVYVMQQRYTKAQPLLQKAMQIAERSYGPNSVDLVSYLDNYSYLLAQTDHRTESKKLKVRANKILEMNGL